MKRRADLEAKAKGMIPRLVSQYGNGNFTIPVVIEPSCFDSISHRDGKWIYRYSMAKGKQWLAPWGYGAYCDKVRVIEADITP
jgi:hypothetical protein